MQELNELTGLNAITLHMMGFIFPESDEIKCHHIFANLFVHKNY